MNLKDLEKHINSSFENYKPKSSDEKIWGAIESKIPRKDKKRRGFFWLWFAISGILLIAVSTFVSDTTKEDELISSYQAEQITEQADEIPIAHISNSSVEEAERSSTENSDQNLASNTEIDEETLVESIVNKNLQFKEQEQISQTEYSKTVDKVLSPLHKNESLAIEAAELRTEGLSKTRLLQGMNFLKRNKAFVLTENIERNRIGIDLPESTYLVDQDLPLRSGILVSTGVYKSFTDYANSGADEALFQNRLDAEKSYENLQFSLKYYREIFDKFFVNLGLNYNSLQRSSNHQKVDQEIIEQSFNSIKRTSVTRLIRYGSDKSLYIPLAIGYRIIESPRIAFDLSVGYEYNIWSRHSGYEIDLNETEYDMALDEEARLNKNSDYITAGISFNYKISKYNRLVFGIEAKQHRHSVYNDQIGIDKSYDFMGLSLGFSRIFK